MEGKAPKASSAEGDNKSPTRKTPPSAGSGKSSKPGSGKDAKPEKKSPAKASKKRDDSDEVLVTIDLTDPDDLMRKLEMIDFTEEEADELMKQALEVNKMLKKALEKHEFEALRKSFSRAVTISATTGEKTSGLMVLPPVDPGGKSKTSLASLNFKHAPRSTPPSAGGSRQSLSRKSSDGSIKKSSAKPKQPPSAKPEWSDRWN